MQKTEKIMNIEDVLASWRYILFPFFEKTLDFSFVNKIIWISLPRDYSITVDSKKHRLDSTLRVYQKHIINLKNIIGYG